MANKCKICNGARSQLMVDRMNPTCGEMACKIAHCDKHIADKRKADEKTEKAEDKAWKADTRKRKEKAKKRIGKNGHYEALKAALHMYIKHVLRRGEPCYTCDLPQKFEDNPQNFHVGHFMPAKTIDPRRFMLENLRIQCNSCNTHNSGRQSVYKERLIIEMGADHVKWLKCEVNHKSLNEQYPEVSDIKAAAAKYRKMYREGMEQIEQT